MKYYMRSSGTSSGVSICLGDCLQMSSAAEENSGWNIVS